MKLGIVGKGGTGKTTTAALITRTLTERGARVVAIDTDSNPNLGLSLGLDLADVDALPALPRSAIVGSAADVSAAELLATYGRATPSGATLLSAIRVTEAGGGCTCGGHATLRSLLSEALEADADVTIVDMEAGLEHLSRAGGTLAYADALLAVMEPSRKSVITAARTVTLAEELGIPRVVALGNKARGDDEAFFRTACEDNGVELAGVLPYDAAVAAADRDGAAITAPLDERTRSELDRVVTLLLGEPQTAAASAE